MRLMECLRLRVQSIDFAQNEITVRDGKGGKDRKTVLPGVVKPALRTHLETVKKIHLEDLHDGYGRVELPYALARKYPGAEKQWKWQYVFPSTMRSPDRRSGVVRRFHMAPTTPQRAFKKPCAPPESGAPTAPSLAPLVHGGKSGRATCAARPEVGTGHRS